MNPVFMQKHSRRISPGHRGGSAGVPGDPGDFGCRLRTPPLHRETQGAVQRHSAHFPASGGHKGHKTPATSPRLEKRRDTAGRVPWQRGSEGREPLGTQGSASPRGCTAGPRASGGGHPLPSADFLSPVFTAHTRRLGSQQTQKDARDSGNASPRRRKARRASRPRPPLFSSRVYLRILVLVTPVVKHFTSFCGKRRDASSSTLTIFLIHHAHSPSPPKIHLKGNSLPVR